MTTTTTTTKESQPRVKIDKRGKNPNSLANLRPFPKGKKAHPGGGYPVSRHLKDLLSEARNGRDIAEKMIERSKILTGRSDASILAQLLDRTEGKVPGDETKTINNLFGDVKILVVYEERKKLDVGT